MKPDIRLATYLIVTKDGQYLSEVGTMMVGKAIWDPHLSNAWRTRDRATARAVAEKYGGQLALFNEILWKVKKL